jgi:hypothetical protein
MTDIILIIAWTASFLAVFGAVMGLFILAFIKEVRENETDTGSGIMDRRGTIGKR